MTRSEPAQPAGADVAPLTAHLQTLIAREGPLSISDFMHAALAHPEHGYYVTRDPLGPPGDFITAPEVSQMFGEMIGLWVVQCWLEMGAPKPFRLVEWGPGRGTMMADMVRAARTHPDFFEATEIHLVETSPVLRRAQRQTLGQIEVTWHDSPTIDGTTPFVVVANEFFDCLPIRQFVRTERGWNERRIAIDNEGRFAFVVDPQAQPPEVDWPDGPVGSIFEYAPAAQAMIDGLSWALRRCPGRALILDYGHTETATADTLQAVRNHRVADIFDAPGTSDLTAHVDFDALARHARHSGARVDGPTTQRDFLLRLGIATRAERLMAGATEADRRLIARQLDRLISPKQMGTLFKAMAVSSPDSAAPQGF